MTISDQHRLWLGSPLWWGDFPTVTITGVTDAARGQVPVISISGSQEIALSQLILTGGRVGLEVRDGSADIGSSLDIQDAALTGNTEQGIRLNHISIAEIGGTTDLRGNGGGPLTCDNTSLAITSSNLKGAKCANIESSGGG